LVESVATGERPIDYYVQAGGFRDRFGGGQVNMEGLISILALTSTMATLVRYPQATVGSAGGSRVCTSGAKPVCCSLWSCCWRLRLPFYSPGNDRSPTSIQPSIADWSISSYAQSEYGPECDSTQKGYQCRPEISHFWYVYSNWAMLNAHTKIVATSGDNTVHSTV